MNIDDLRLRQAEFEADRSDIKKKYLELEKIRTDFVTFFTKEKIKNLLIDEYVVGKGLNESFCCLIENKLKQLGDIHGATAFKFGIYFGKTKSDNEKKYRVVEKKFGKEISVAFEKVKSSILCLLDDGQKGNISGVKKNLISPMFKGKILAVYFPDKYLGIYSSQHLNHFLNRLEISYSKKDDEIIKREYLINFKNRDNIMREWNNYEFSRFLYNKIGKPLSIGNVIHEELEDYVEFDFPDVKDIKYELIDRDLNDLKEKNDKQEGVVLRKIDFEKENKINRRVGMQGELIVMEIERQLLIKSGKEHLITGLIQKSKESDSFGYDIESFDEKDDKKYIEVKSTKRKLSNFDIDFFMSANEVLQAKKYDNYYVYIVFEVHTKNPKVFQLKKPFNQSNKKIEILPINYKIRINL